MSYMIRNNGLFTNVFNQEKILSSIKNNEIMAVHICKYADINFFKQLFELLKNNSSVKRLIITYNSNYGHSDNNNNNNNNISNNEFYKLLSDCLAIDTYFNVVCLVDDNINAENLVLISNALKNNNSLIEVELCYKNLKKNECKYIIDSLKFNKTLTYIVIYINSISANHIVELLKVNTTLRSLEIRSRIKKPRIICNTLQNNRNITYFSVYSQMDIDIDIHNIISDYCERNMHNLKLKSLLIEDL
jgi:hypothetical protein